MRFYIDEETVYKGLTIRQHFAGLAMQGLLSGPTVVPDSKGIAICAVDMADALLKELSK